MLKAYLKVCSMLKTESDRLEYFIHFQTERRVLRSNDHAFSKMELKTLQFQVDMFEDEKDEKSKMKVILSLENVVLDDTRLQKTKCKFIRLVEKYSTPHFVPTKMIQFSYESRMVRAINDDGRNSSANDIKFVNEQKSIFFHFDRLKMNISLILFILFL